MTEVPTDEGEGCEAQGGAQLVLPSAGDVETLVRARGAMFLVTNREGDVEPSGARELGLFHRDTRYLSRWALRVAGVETVHLSAQGVGDAYNQVDSMATDLEVGELLDDPKNFLHIRRRQMLDDGFLEQIAFTSFLPRALDLDVSIAWGVDFADIFEVRGARRPRRGALRPPRIEGRRVVFGYDGLDGRHYETTIVVLTQGARVSEDGAELRMTIDAGEELLVELQVDCRASGAPSTRTRFPFARRAERIQREADELRASSTRFVCDEPTIQRVLDQAIADLHALRVDVAHGDETHRIVGAGIPWFCAPFGRDSLIASYEALTLNPDFAIDTLRTLAAFQGKKDDPEREEEPGKIFHELRFGEMARTREVPYSPYYGSADATPLFVIVAEAAFRFTADRALLTELRQPIVDALAFLDARTEEATKLVTYERVAPMGLDNQGWKDSRAGVSFPDGRPAKPPIALCEVQGYCVDAYERGAKLLSALGEHDLAKRYAERAAKMHALVEHALWLPREKRFAYAIDGEGRALDTVVSNLGHLLWSGVPSRAQAAALAELLLSPAMASGFGVRTLAEGQRVYNPLSYHNGTVWPHDNALIAAGLARYDRPLDVLAVFDGIHAAMGAFRDHRLPELHCGMSRASGPLVRYPVACSPQAWAAAAPFLFLQSLLGLEVDAWRHRLVIRNPILPTYIRRVEIQGMRVGATTVSMRFRRVGKRCHLDRLDVSGGTLKTEMELD